ncbi:MAG: hypothetical protein IT249_09460 [Chitinophagaceae bacterium]|nr:hypothetical protein [Chitinophagaceae bacterium]
MRRSNELFPNEIDFVKVYAVYSRVSRKMYPDSVNVNTSDWTLKICYTKYQLDKCVNMLLRSEHLVWFIDYIHVPVKVKNEPLKITI